MRNDEVEEERTSDEESVMNAVTGSAVTVQTVDKPVRIPQELCVELLPGISNDIALMICAKMSWRQLQILPTLSPGWRQAFQSRLIYDTRVRTHSRESLVLVRYYRRDCLSTSPNPERFALYSIRDKSWYLHLPQVPFLTRQDFQWILLDTKIYILLAIAKVYVLDLAEQTPKWTECESMLHKAIIGLDAVGAFDGKIYVFSTWWDGERCQVYDPKVNAWSESLVSIPENVDNDPTKVGEELRIYTDGGHYNPCRFMVYNPVKNELRSTCLRITDFADDRPNHFYFTGCNIFVDSEGTYHCFTDDGISRRDSATGSWSHLHSFSEDIHIEAGSIKHSNGPNAIPFGDEFLKWNWNGDSLFLTRGFGTEDGVIIELRLADAPRNSRDHSDSPREEWEIIDSCEIQL